MIVGVITNHDKDPGLSYTAQVCEFLTGRGVKVATHGGLLTASFWLILGGDGTMLQNSHVAARHNIPLLGINLGNLGFLTDAEKQNGLDSIANVLAGKYKTEKRLMIQTQNNIALNDICIGTGGGLKAFSISVNDTLIDTIRADGVVVSTPTGSTAYNLSAGGPILMPGGQMMVVTPVCPHSIGIRPLVIGAEDTVEITPHQSTPLFIDGENMGNTSESVHICKSEFFATIMKTSATHLYETLREKKIL